MSIERVKAYFREYGLEGRVRELDMSSATVELAAAALNGREYPLPEAVPEGGAFS